MVTVHFANPARFECQLKYDGAEGLLVARPLLPVDGEVVEVEEFEILVSLEKIVKCWHLWSHICEE